MITILIPSILRPSGIVLYMTSNSNFQFAEEEEEEEEEGEDVVRNGSSTNKFRLHPEKYPPCSQRAGRSKTKKTEKS